jgi:phage/plasmid-like protein (TIGR03299 family)
MSAVMEGGEPWHGLGQRLTARATRDEILTAANLSWPVLQSPVILRVGGVDLELDTHKINYRVLTDGTPRPLGVVGADYSVVQHSQLGELAEAIVGESGGIYDTAGAIYGGRRVWVCVKLDWLQNAIQGDPIDAYLTVMSSHDGSMAVSIWRSGIRTVCKNTIMSGISQAEGRGNLWQVRHTSGARVRLDELKRTLVGIREDFQQNVQTLQALKAAPWDLDVVNRMLEDLWPIADVENPSRAYSIRTDKRDRVLELARDESRGNNGTTLYDAYNGLSDYVSHELVPVRTIQQAERRMLSMANGTGADLLVQGRKVLTDSLK